jgi:hypothetical protein
MNYLSQTKNYELRDAAMTLIDWLRKGFGYVLLSMGVSRPTPKQKPEANSETKATPKSENGS